MSIRKRDARQLIFTVTPLGIEVEVGLLLSHYLAFRIENLHLHGDVGMMRILSHSRRNRLIDFQLIDNLRTDIHLLVVDGTDEERMTREVQLGVGDDEIDITIETGTRVPTRVVGVASIRLHRNLVHLSILQEFGNIGIHSEIAIVGAPDALSIEIDISHQHNALEVEHDALALPFLLRSQFIAIPADAHLLESTRTQTAAHIAARITVVGSLAGIRSHPVL